MQGGATSPLYLLLFMPGRINFENKYTNPASFKIYLNLYPFLKILISGFPFKFQSLSMKYFKYSTTCLWSFMFEKRLVNYDIRDEIIRGQYIII